jgi:putative transposase
LCRRIPEPDDRELVKGNTVTINDPAKSFFTEIWLFFITTSIIQHQEPFKTPEDFAIIERNIEFYRIRDNAKIYAYVIMPHHLHLIIDMPAEKSISDYMRDFKRRSSIEFFKSINHETGRLWQEKFDDLDLITYQVFLTKINYIHMNPVRSGLVSEPEDWPYSSARYYSNGESNIIHSSHFNE